ncbi:MAG: hypothetical protein AAFY91_13480 [Bacteroidota bacterium]
MKEGEANGFEDFILRNEKPLLIYPKSKAVILSPTIVETDKGKDQVWYFVFFPDSNQVYEWNYLGRLDIEGERWLYGGRIVDHLSLAVEWNFGFDYLEDQIFWQDKVLFRTDKGYQYLQEID